MDASPSSHGDLWMSTTNSHHFMTIHHGSDGMDQPGGFGTPRTHHVSHQFFHRHNDDETMMSHHVWGRVAMDSGCSTKGPLEIVHQTSLAFHRNVAQSFHRLSSAVDLDVRSDHCSKTGL